MAPGFTEVPFGLVESSFLAFEEDRGLAGDLEARGDGMVQGPAGKSPNEI